MSDPISHQDITPEQAAIIDQRIGHTFAFLRDVLARPGILEEIPDGAILRHRDVVLIAPAVVVRLTAYRTPEMPHWEATVTGATIEQAVTAVHGFPITTGPTPEAAFDALEAELRRTIEASALPH